MLIKAPRPSFTASHLVRLSREFYRGIDLPISVFALPGGRR